MQKIQSAISRFTNVSFRRFVLLMLPIFCLLIGMDKFVSYLGGLVQREIELKEDQAKIAKQKQYQSLQAGMGESYSNATQVKLMNLFGLPKGLFTPKDIEQVLGVKLIKFDEQYSYSNEELYLDINPRYFSFSWLKLGGEVGSFPIGNCVSYEAFKTSLGEIGWNRVWLSPKPALRGWDEQRHADHFYHYKNPRRWMFIDMDANFDCIEHIVVYDTKNGKEPEVERLYPKEMTYPEKRHQLPPPSPKPLNVPIYND